MNKGFKSILIVGILVGILAFAALASQTFSIYEWWTGGTKPAITAVLNMYQQQYPNVKVVKNPVAGPAGLNMQAVIKSLILGGVPPTTFQVLGGGSLYGYASAKLLQPVTNFWKTEGLTKLVPKEVQKLCSYNGQFYGVPMDICRANMLWYNKAIFDKLGLTVPTTLKEFLSLLPKIKAAGYIPLALGDASGFGPGMLFEQTLLSNLGDKKYNEYLAGKINASDPAFQQAISDFRTELKYVNSDHGSLTWQEAATLLVEGKAAMTVMGDFSMPIFTRLGWTPDVNYGAVAFPGTSGTYNVITDTFVLPKGVSNTKLAINWFKLITSIPVQEKFNQMKVSVPIRMDVPTTSFKSNPIQVQNMKDFKIDKFVGSITNGGAPTQTFETDWMNAVETVEYHPNMPMNSIVNLFNSVSQEDIQANQ